MGEQDYVMGRAARQMSQSALDAPPPSAGEVRRTALPDTFDGIRFEIGRMIKHVKMAEKDPVVQAHVKEITGAYLDYVAEETRMNGSEYPKDLETTLAIEAIDLWCRDHYVYVNDPPNIEVIQTPVRMIKQTKVPPEVISYIISPFYDEFAAYDGKIRVEDYVPPSIYIGDCDEGSACMLGQCICVPGARPLQFKFGGNLETLHHVWALIGGDGKMYDCDHTEPGYVMGQFSKFKTYETAEVAA
ncbi:MAG TPA: hypothetical protein VEN81_01880 [Planctomycetota bacterium]|nr:hypothetical protein [Planctomycetota bacterium]